MDKRKLTDAEIDWLKNIFADSIDYETVSIYKLKLPGFLPHNAMSFGGNIYFPADYYCEDFSITSGYFRRWFVHEMTHVWQSQNGFPVLFAGLLIFLTGGYLKKRAYNYQKAILNGKNFSQLNMEQQASLLSDFFIPSDDNKDIPLSKSMRCFVQQRDASCNLPYFFS